MEASTLLAILLLNQTKIGCQVQSDLLSDKHIRTKFCSRPSGKFLNMAKQRFIILMYTLFQSIII